MVQACGAYTGGEALRFANSDLQNDRDFVLALIELAPESLQHASANLRADREVVLSAAHRHRCALEFAAPALLQDRQSLEWDLAHMSSSPAPSKSSLDFTSLLILPDPLGDFETVSQITPTVETHV